MRQFPCRRAGFALVLVLALGAPLPVSAQSVSDQVGRQITRSVSDAASRALEQAVVRPTLRVKDGAGPVLYAGTAHDGRTLALVLESGTVRVWDLAQGIQRPVIRPQARARVAVPLDGGSEIVVGLEDGRVLLLDTLTGREKAVLGRHVSAPRALAVRGDGTLAATAAAESEIRLWSIGPPKPRPTLAGAGREIGALAFDASGRRVAAAGADGAVRVWDVESGALLQSLETRDGSILALGFAGEDLVLASAKGSVLRAESGRGSIVTASAGAGKEAVSAAIDASGRLAAFGGERGAIRLVDVASGGLLRELVAPASAMRALAFDARSGRLFSGDAGGALRVWDTASGESLVQATMTEAGWAVIDRQGRFDGSEQGMNDVGWDAKERALTLEQFSQQFFEPGLLASYMRPDGVRLTQPPGSVEAGIRLPPRVEIDLPDPDRVAGRPFELVVVAEDQGGGIGAVRLYHNGKLVVPGSLLQQQDVSAEKRRLRATAFRIRPVPGVNTLKAVASGEWGIEGESERLTLPFTGPVVPAKLQIVAVGIDHYSNPEMNLSYSVQDAKEMISRLASGAKGLYPVVDVQQLFDRDATREKILHVLAGLAALATEDVVVVYLAGHGIVAGDDWYFMPWETKGLASDAEIRRVGIGASEIRDALVGARSQRVLVLIDSCESGASIEAFERMERFQRRYIREVSRLAGVSLLSATRGDQLAAEIARLGHGLFTYVVLDGLGGKADVQPHDGEVTAHELVGFSAATTPAVSRQYLPRTQEPLAFALGSDFALRRGSD